MAKDRVLANVRRVLAALLTLSTVGGCKILEKLGPHEGDSCSGDVAVCRGHDFALACHNKKYVQTKCAGPEGCSVKGETLLCDFSTATADDKCPAEWDDQAKCHGSDAYVECHDGHYRPFECRGPKGCATADKKVACDMSVVKEGDACSEEGSASCSKDKTTFYSCKNGTMGEATPCRGPNGCSVNPGNKIGCDKSASLENDPCDAAGAACTPDGAKMLTCLDGKMSLKHVCRGGPCKVENDTVQCTNWGIGDVGDPCTNDAAACSSDGKAFLKCKDGKFAAARQCKCETTGTDVRCK
jgi:hypothetical protein